MKYPTIAGFLLLSTASTGFSQNTASIQQVIEDLTNSTISQGGVVEDVGNLTVYRSAPSDASSISFAEIDARGIIESESLDILFDSINPDLGPITVYTFVGPKGEQQFFVPAPDSEKFIKIVDICILMPWLCNFQTAAPGDSWTLIPPIGLSNLEGEIEGAISAEGLGMLFQSDGGVTVLRSFLGAPYYTNLEGASVGGEAQFRMKLLPALDR